MMGVSSVAKVEEFEKEKGEQFEDEDEDEIELSLELSIGRKSYTKANPSHNKLSMDSSSSCPKMGGLDFTEEAQISVVPRSVVANIDLDQHSKREIQALKRQEARKKREEKLKIKAISRGKKGHYCSVNGDRERRENHDDEEEEAEPPRKKEKNEKIVQNHEEAVVKDLNLAFNNNIGSNSTGQMQYPYRPALQYVPFTNGFVYPCGVVPCWGPVAADNGNGTGGNEGQEKEKRVNFGNGTGGNGGPEKEKKVSFEPAACRSFRPYNRNSEQNGNGRLDGSSGGSSSAVSDYQNSSLQGGNNSDAGSCSSKFPQERNRQEEKSENDCDSNGMKSNEAEEKATTNHIVNIVSSSIHQSNEAKRSEEPKSATEQADPLNQPILSTQDPIPPTPLKEETTNGVTGKPHTPQTELHGAPSLPQMPCVSTTGNGPNGKTVTGFLYRYTKTEVSIVCVCHGTSFSPAEFVEHAGGVDVAHPLRHITVIPSAFV